MIWMAARVIACWCVAIAMTAPGGCGEDKSDEANVSHEVSGSFADVPSTPAAIAAHNLAVAHMGRFEYDAAIEILRTLSGEYPDWLDGRVDLAIAILNRQASGDNEEAMAILREVLAASGDHLRARFCLGVLLLHGGDAGEALPHFEFVSLTDPSDAYAMYDAGQCHAQLDRPENALVWFKRASRTDPYLRSAYYGAFGALSQLGRNDEASDQLAMFQKLATNPQARLAEFKYTRIGPKAEVRAIAVNPPADADDRAAMIKWAAQALPVTGPEITWIREAGDGVKPTITTCDIDGDGRSDLFFTSAIGNAQGALNAVLFARDDGFELAGDHPLATVRDVRATLWGDIDNDGLTDVYFCRRGANQLWRQSAANVWEDITSAAGVSGGEHDTVDGAIFDADHDGDLDLYLVNADGDNDLLNNNLDGTFRSIGRERGLAGRIVQSHGVLPTDLDNDRDVDLILLHDDGPAEVKTNELMWSYSGADAFAMTGGEPIVAALAVDIDADGQTQIVAASRTALTLWKRDEGAWRSQALTHEMMNIAGPMALMDVRGLGTFDVVFPVMDDNGLATQLMAVNLVDNPTIKRGEVLGEVEGEILAWQPMVMKTGRGAVIVALTPDGPMLWQRVEDESARYLTLSFTGKSSVADQMRSNASGIGVRYAVRNGGRWTVGENLRMFSGPGQSVGPISIGAAGASRVDFVRVSWPDGLQQTEMGLDTGRGYVIEETQRQTSSCPVLFAWDGQRYRFVTDFLGVGGVGFAVGPGEYAPPRPWENVLLPAGLLKQRDGVLSIKIGEPMQEACYLDAASLVAYDLPPGWKMTLDERMGINDPQPTGEVRYYKRSILAARAMNDRGEDVTQAIARADGRAAPVGELDRRFIGRTQEHVLTMIFDQAIDAHGSHASPMLVIHGWVEYPYSQTMFAAWQAGATYDAPTLEARGADGTWHVVLEQFGYPAGFPREMSVPIPMERIPEGTRELQLRTNMEIYWDQVTLAWAEPCPEARRRVSPLRKANLGEVGFALRTTGPQRQPEYDYNQRAPLWDAAYQRGFYTRLGAVDELVARTDDTVVILGPGEEVHLDFTAPSNDLETGWTRRWVLETAGWCKDMDLYTKDGATVGPVPVREGSSDNSGERDALHERYQTRFRSGG